MTVDEIRRLPMFPLGTVLMPSGFLPLHLFEDRYCQLIVDLMAGDREFGVVLIRRGSEVGGGEQRCDVGTRARVIEARQAPDGRWSVATVGLQRIRVRTWLADDPYPMAEVTTMPDRPGTPADQSTFRELTKAVRGVLAGLSELGEPVAEATFEVADDPALGGLQLAALAPISIHDRQRLLECDRASERLAMLGHLVGEAREVVDLRLGGHLDGS
jgi:Lon protease-like protein